MLPCLVKALINRALSLLVNALLMEASLPPAASSRPGEKMESSDIIELPNNYLLRVYKYVLSFNCVSLLGDSFSPFVTSGITPSPPEDYSDANC